MKKLIILALVISFLAVSAVAMASGNKGNKVDVCHIIAANDEIPFGFGPVPTVLLKFGKIISVAPSAVPVHEAHGDSTVFSTNDFSVDLFIAAGAKLPAADCWTNHPLP